MKQCKNLEGIHKIQFFCSSSSILFSSAFCPQANWMTQSILDLQSAICIHEHASSSNHLVNQQRVQGESWALCPIRWGQRLAETVDCPVQLWMVVHFFYKPQSPLYAYHNGSSGNPTVGDFCYLKLPLAAWHWFPLTWPCKCPPPRPAPRMRWTLHPSRAPCQSEWESSVHFRI